MKTYSVICSVWQRSVGSDIDAKLPEGGGLSGGAVPKKASADAILPCMPSQHRQTEPGAAPPALGLVGTGPGRRRARRRQRGSKRSRRRRRRRSALPIQNPHPGTRKHRQTEPGAAAPALGLWASSPGCCRPTQRRCSSAAPPYRWVTATCGCCCSQSVLRNPAKMNTGGMTHQHGLCAFPLRRQRQIVWWARLSTWRPPGS